MRRGRGGGGKDRHVRQTLLAVGEGDTEEAFLKHLRELYCADGVGVSVTIRNARGKGPEHVVGHAVGQCRDADYDHRLVLLDTDLPWTESLQKRARQHRICMVGSTPSCIEGLFLRILGAAVTEGISSSEYKRRLRDRTGRDMTEKAHYEQLFTKSVLEEARSRIPLLDELLRYFNGVKS